MFSFVSALSGWSPWRIRSSPICPADLCPSPPPSLRPPFSHLPTRLSFVFITCVLCAWCRDKYLTITVETPSQARSSEMYTSHFSTGPGVRCYGSVNKAWAWVRRLCWSWALTDECQSWAGPGAGLQLGGEERTRASGTKGAAIQKYLIFPGKSKGFCASRPMIVDPEQGLIPVNMWQPSQGVLSLSHGKWGGSLWDRWNRRVTVTYKESICVKWRDCSGRDVQVGFEGALTVSVRFQAAFKDKNLHLEPFNIWHKAVFY